MATTTLPRELDTTPAERSPAPLPQRRTGLLGWGLVAVALAVASVLAVRALGSDDDTVPSTPWYSVEHGSVAALDHASQQLRDRPFAVESGSVAAIDHAAGDAPEDG